MEHAALRREDVETCLAILAQGSKSFSAASRLLPKRLRAPVAVVYALCRVADDLIDQAETRAEKDRALAQVLGRVERIYRNGPHADPVDRAFSAVARAYAIPKEVLLYLVEGFRWDVEQRRYATFEDLTAYAVRVASTVGVMMTLLMGRRAESVLARACDLGIAMQLTNIARDVGEDARAGRLYLPTDWMTEAGLDPDHWQKEPLFSPALGRVVARLLANADAFYARADAGVPALPIDCRPAISAARHIYSEIGNHIRANDCDSVRVRASTGRREKLLIFATRVPGDLWTRHEGLSARCDPAARDLVRAASEGG